jgi:hypothetical protein
VYRLLSAAFDKSSALHLKKRAVVALNASFEMHPGTVEDELAKRLSKVIRDVDDALLPSASTFVARLRPGWRVADQPARDKMISFVTKGPALDVAKRVGTLSEIDELSVHLEMRIAGFSVEELALVIGVEKLWNAVKRRAFQLVSEVRSWNAANSILNKVILLVFDRLDAGDVRELIRMPTTADADLPGSAAYREFIEKVHASGIIRPDEFNQLLKENKASYLLANDLG